MSNHTQSVKVYMQNESATFVGKTSDARGRIIIKRNTSSVRTEQQ